MEDKDYALALEEDTGVWKACETFPTREEAVSAGKLALLSINEGKTYVDSLGMHVEDIFGALPEKGTTSFAVGQFNKAVISVDVVGMLESVGEQLYSEYGEVAEDYYPTDEVSDEAIDELHDIIANWLDKNLTQPPSFGSVDDVEKITLEGENK